MISVWTRWYWMMIDVSLNLWTLKIRIFLIKILNALSKFQFFLLKIFGCSSENFECSSKFVMYFWKLQMLQILLIKHWKLWVLLKNLECYFENFECSKFGWSNTAFESINSKQDSTIIQYWDMVSLRITIRHWNQMPLAHQLLPLPEKHVWNQKLCIQEDIGFGIIFLKYDSFPSPNPIGGDALGWVRGFY